MIDYLRKAAKSLDNAINNITLRTKLILSLLLLGFLPLFIAGAVLLTRLGNLAQKQAEDAVVLALAQTAANVDSAMRNYESLADNILYDTSLSPRLSRNYRSLDEAVDFYYSWWARRNDLLKVRSDIIGVTIYTDNRTLVSTPPYVMMMNDAFRKNPAIMKLLSKSSGSIWSGLRQINAKGNYWQDMAGGGGGSTAVFSLSKAFLRLGHNEPANVLTLAISIEALHGLIAIQGNPEDFVVFDETGSVVTSSNDAYLGQDSNKVLAKSLAELPDRGSYLASDNMTSITHRRLACGWRIAALLNIADLRAEAGRLRLFGLMVIVLSALLVCGMVAYISEMLSRRTRQLVKKMQNLDHAVLDPGPAIGGRDEVGQIDRSFTEMALEMKQSIEQRYALQEQKNKAVLEALQARINPHFLYNTLSTIGWMSEYSTPAEVREALEHLSSFYRVTLSGGQEVIMLEEELGGLHAYLSIQSLRAPGRVEVYFDMDPCITNVPIPKMTLQPIVENCMEHGISSDKPTISVMVRGRVSGNDAVVEVIDDGAGMGDKQLQEILAGLGEERCKEGGYGLKNVNQRLIMHFGTEYGLCIESILGKGTTVIVRTPMTMDNNNQNNR